MTRPNALDTRFRTALQRIADAGQLLTYSDPVDTHLEAAGIMKQLDGQGTLFFSAVKSHGMPVVGNLLCSKETCEAAFGLDYRELRECIGRALSAPCPPAIVTRAPAQEHVVTSGIDLARALPVLHHTEADAGRFITAGIVVTRDPETKVYNASYHRLQLIAPDRTAIKLDYGRHLRLAFERAKRRGESLPVAICIGADLALQFAAATMGSQMPEDADELAAAGGLAGQPIEVARAVTQDLLVPAESEIILEGRIRTDTTVDEGPFGEFVGYLSPQDQAPVVEITALTHRDRPIYHAINGFGRETVMLRKYVLEASLMKVLRGAVPIVADVEMTAGGLHRFHVVVSIRKSVPQHDGLERNAIAACFGALKDLDLAIVVDDDIDIRDPGDVEYALATRMEASRDLMILPAARGHEYVRIGRNGIRAKLGIDATVPFEERHRFARCTFTPVTIDKAKLSRSGAVAARWLAQDVDGWVP